MGYIPKFGYNPYANLPVHNCPLCYTDLKHSELMRMLPGNELWRMKWAQNLPADIDREILNSFVISTLSAYYYDITYRQYYLETFNILLNNPEFDPTFSDNKLIRTVISHYNSDCCVYARRSLNLPSFKNPMVACIWAHPAVRASYKPPSKVEYEIEVEDWIGKKTRLCIDDELSRAWQTCVINQCKKIKGELIERTWHPDRVWNWCFDEEEKRDFETA
jgi:hypothetical protein